MNGGGSKFFEPTESIRGDDDPSQVMAEKINYLITDVDEFFTKNNIPQTDPRRKDWELFAKKCLRKLESDLSHSETTIPNNECHEDSQYEFTSIDRTACEKQVIEEWSWQPADTGSDPVYFHDSKTQDYDELQELLHDSHLRDNSYVPSGPGADTIKEYRRQLVASEKLMPTVKDAYGSRLVTPLPLSTGQSSSTAQKQQCLSTPGPVESMPTSRLEDGLTTDRPENNELTTSTSQEGLTTGMASETSGRHEFVAAEGKKPPDIRKEEEETDHGDLEHSHKIEHDCLRTAVAAISQYHKRKRFKGNTRTPGSLQPITGKYQWEILNEAFFSVLCVLESAAKITLRLPIAKVIDFQKQDLQACCKPFLDAFPEKDCEFLPNPEQLVGIRNAIAHANTEYLVDFQSSKCGLEGERNDVILYTLKDVRYVESFRSSTDVFSKVCERMRKVFLEWGPVREYLPQGASVNVSGHLDEVYEPVESVEEDTSIP